MENVQIPSSKADINSYACRITETPFRALNNYFWKVPISKIIQKHWKNQLYWELFNFSLNVEYVQLYNFRFWNCLWTRNAYRLPVQTVFMFQMLGQTSIVTLPGKVSLWQKCQNDVLCGNVNMDLSLYILKLQFFLKNTCSTKIAPIHVVPF